MPTSSHLCVLVASRLLRDTERRFPQSGGKYFLLLAQAHRANATLALWVYLVISPSPLLLCCFQKQKRFASDQTFCFPLLFLWRDMPAFLYFSHQPDIVLTKLWDYVPGQGCWVTSVGVWQTLRLWGHRLWLRGQRPVFWSWRMMLLFLRSQLIEF